MRDTVSETDRAAIRPARLNHGEGWGAGGHRRAARRPHPPLIKSALVRGADGRRVATLLLHAREGEFEPGN
ncbi:hypothetical protein [Ovoidimarina sediminis]|uniref:hypothetical protein n=1 Tax=Ovoidimarina sediminis TaxID=3079856 RepID=UPI002912FE3E|nr:hypothetical protein [Rhodophyticola sp. MJ-SS7]MDU8945737.1 hypothetical protein [Rhodophyticola sp. MJ-SS7]